MAITTLPRAGAGSIGTGGVRKAKLPDAGDVPVQGVLQGVRAPDTTAVGRGIQDLGSALDGLMVRQAGISRDSDDTDYDEQLTNIIRDLEKTGDFTQQDIIDQAGEQASQLKEQILSGHRGGAESRAMLENRLERRRIGFADTLAVKNIEGTNALQKDKFNRRNRGMTAQILSDPDVLLEPDLGTVFRKYDEALEEDIVFMGAVSPSLKRAFTDIGRENIAQSMITPLIKEGDFARAKEFLNNPATKEVLDPAFRREAAGRISAAERELSKARSEGTAAIEKARVLAGPSASEEEVRAMAQQMEGITASSGNDIDQWVTVGTDVMGVSKTGAVVAKIAGPTPEDEARAEGLKIEAKLGARLDFMNNVLGQAGAQPLPNETEASQPTDGEPKEGQEQKQAEVRAMTAPFGPEEPPASDDLQSAMTLFMASRRLLAAGDPLKNAAGFMQQARFIIENSPDIQRGKALDKPLSVDAASEFGVPVGSTLRDVMGRIPKSPGELAQERGAGSARGRESVEGEEQVAFIDEASIMITDLLDEIKADPGIVGVRGSLRSTGQAALGVVGDLGFDSLVEGAREMAFESADLGLESVTEMFDSPTLSVLDILENSIGLILARLRTPSGRIPVDVIKRSISDVGLTGLKGSERVENRLVFVLDQLNRRKGSVNKRFGLEEPDEEQDVPRFRIEGGAIVPVEE